MILQEIVHTCSNPHVARAALASIGGDFAADFADRASQRNMPVGVLAARLVKEFSIKADEHEWDGVDEAVRGADQPILSGLRYILSHGLGGKYAPAGSRDDDRPAAWVRRAGAARDCHA
ncbi:MAG: hypothetical protein ACLQE9_15210 [Roseiarcus sp.]